MKLFRCPLQWFNQKSLSQKTSLVMLAFVALSIPVSLFMVFHPIRIKSKASAGTQIAVVNTPDNHTPSLATTSFSEGHINQPYSLTLQGYDLDTTDTLKITTFGLPLGLKVTNCQPFSTPAVANNLSCLITGIPKKSGTYHIYVTLRDNHASSTQTRFNLDID